MPLDAPNFFDEADFARMRTPSKTYDPDTDYSRIIAQLREARREFGYRAISPQNLVEPAELLPVKELPYYDKPERAYVAPAVIEQSGWRLQWEGCANIRLVRNGKKFPAYVKTSRPTRVVLSYRVEGRVQTTTYRDRRPKESKNMSTIALICHEIDHTKGRLITDLAYIRLLKIRKILAEECAKRPDEARILRLGVENISPYVLVRDGDRYMLRLASEFEDVALPPVSPDALYVDILFIRRKGDIERTFVPRGGELLPIKPSDKFLFFADLLARA